MSDEQPVGVAVRLVGIMLMLIMGAVAALVAILAAFAVGGLLGSPRGASASRPACV